MVAFRAYPAILCVALASCNQIFGLNEPVEFVPPDAAPPMFGVCMVETFDSLDPTRWVRQNTGMPLQVDVTGGELVIDGTSAIPVTDGLVTKQAYDFRDGTVEVQLTDTVVQTGRSARLKIVTTDGFIQIVRSPGSLFLEVQRGAMSSNSFHPPPIDTDPFWRIRHLGMTSELVLDTSPDGVAYHDLLSTMDSFGIIESTFELTASADANAVDRSAFDNFKLTALCPP